MSVQQNETTTAARAGLGIEVANTGATGTPVVVCGAVSTSYTCAVTGVHNAGKVVFYAEFDSIGTRVVYSDTQDSDIAVYGSNPGNCDHHRGILELQPLRLSPCRTPALLQERRP